MNVNDLSEVLKPMMIAILSHDGELKDCTKEEIEVHYQKNCSTIVTDFIESMKIASKEIKDKKTGNRYSPTRLRMALSIWSRSPTLYRSLTAEGTLKLPCERTVLLYKSGMKRYSGNALIILFNFTFSFLLQIINTS